MSPRNAVSILVVLAATSTAWRGFRDADARKNDPLATPSPTPAVAAHPEDFRLLWTHTRIGGATLDCPFLLKALNSENVYYPEGSASVQRFGGGPQNCRI